MLWLTPACGTRDAAPNLLLVVIDTLRADRLGSHGNPRGLTPFLDELADRGTRFANAYATSSWTSPSVASLLTSRHSIQHGVSGFESVLSDRETTLAERLTAHGYACAGFSANARIREELGYGQGFEAWSALGSTPRPDGGVPKTRAARIHVEALRWLDAEWSPDSGRPAFLYLQYMEPHTPYEPPEPFRERFARPGATVVAARAANRVAASLRFSELDEEQVAVLESLYDGEVATVDAELRALFDELERRGFLDGAIVVVTSDHGEEFREHDAMLHGLTLHEAAVRVPLIVMGPGIESGREVERNVSLIDVVPTVLDLLGMTRDAALEGRSLARLLRDADADADSGGDLFFELAPKKTWVDLRAHTHGMLRGSRKLLLTPRDGPVVYDLATDPDESRPVGDAPELREALLRARQDLALRATAGVETLPLDEATREELRALGYAVEPAK